MPLERRSYWDLMQKYGKVANLPKEKRRFLSLRHSIVVHLLDARVDVAFARSARPCQYPEYHGLYALQDGEAGYPDAGIVCQSPDRVMAI